MKKPRPVRHDDPRVVAFQPGRMTEETKAAIAAHREKYLQARQQRRTDPEPDSSGAVTVKDADGFVVIRPSRENNRFTGEQPSGMMAFDDCQQRLSEVKREEIEADARAEDLWILRGGSGE